MSVGLDFKSLIDADQIFKQLGELNGLSNVFLNALHAERPEHKPQFKRSKATTQAHLPMHVVNGGAWIFMVQIERRYGECFVQPSGIIHPEARAVKVDHEPLGRVEHERIGLLNAVEEVPKLGTKECTARIGRVYVKPNLLRFAYGPDLAQVVKRTRARCAQRSAHEKRYQTVSFVLFNRLF